MNFRISDHARDECARRQIPLDVLHQVLEHPDQILAAEYGRQVYQAKVWFGEKLYLVRAIVDLDDEPAAVVTVYRTSKIEKYWSENP